jgi:hypothetical protein
MHAKGTTLGGQAQEPHIGSPAAIDTVTQPGMDGTCSRLAVGRVIDDLDAELQQLRCGPTM